MPLRRTPNEVNRRRLSLKARAELRTKELAERRRQVEDLAGEIIPQVEQLAGHLEQLVSAEDQVPPVVYVEAARAAAQLAALLAAPHTGAKHAAAVEAMATLSEKMKDVEKYHESAGFWELRTQIKEVVDPVTQEVWDTRVYGPYVYRRFIKPDGRDGIQYYGRNISSLPEDAPALEDMRETSSTGRIFWPKPKDKKK
jgi:hypothetical protein